jgi:hypothetical protein
MSFRPRINFENVYPFKGINKDLRLFIFQSPLQEGNSVPLYVRISETPHEVLPNVYNLGFGPITKTNQIDDNVQLRHANYSRVFSTILFACLSYLSANKEQFIGLDGSENIRAWYYWRILQFNFEYLSKHFNIYGLKYYVRISRFGKSHYENPFDFEDIHFRPVLIKKTTERLDHMYNYFIFGLKNNNFLNF